GRRRPRRRGTRPLPWRRRSQSHLRRYRRAPLPVGGRQAVRNRLLLAAVLVPMRGGSTIFFARGGALSLLLDGRRARARLLDAHRNPRLAPGGRMPAARLPQLKRIEEILDLCRPDAGGIEAYDAAVATLESVER